MKKNSTHLLLGGLAVGIAITGLSTPEASAQLNERRVERQATGVYKGRTKNGKRIFFNGNTRTGSGTPHNAAGKLKVPVKDGRLATSLKDSQLPGNDRTKIRGREQKSNVRRNGNKIAVKAKGYQDVYGDSYGKMRGDIRGNLLKRGSSWVADTKAEGKRNEGGTFSSVFKSDVNGKH